MRMRFLSRGLFQYTRLRCLMCQRVVLRSTLHPLRPRLYLAKRKPARKLINTRMRQRPINRASRVPRVAPAEAPHRHRWRSSSIRLKSSISSNSIRPLTTLSTLRYRAKMRIIWRTSSQGSNFFDSPDDEQYQHTAYTGHEQQSAVCVDYTVDPQAQHQHQHQRQHQRQQPMGYAADIGYVVPRCMDAYGSYGAYASVLSSNAW